MGRMKDLFITINRGGREAVEAAQLLAGMAKWVPCTERVPELITPTLSEVVLAWKPGNDFPQPAFVQLEDGKRVWRWGFSVPPTHWMPMPEVPE